MCQLCKRILKGNMTMPELKDELPRRIDMEQDKKRKLHYQQLYGNLLAAYKRVLGQKSRTMKVWRRSDEKQDEDRY